MTVLQIGALCLWIVGLVIGACWVIFRYIMPHYRITVSDVTFNDLIFTLNIAINTELELWEKDILKNKKNSIGTNSRYDNYYYEITSHIVQTLSPIFYENIQKYITEEAVASIVARRVKIFLNDHTDTI